VLRVDALGLRLHLHAPAALAAALRTEFAELWQSGRAEPAPGDPAAVARELHFQSDGRLADSDYPAVDATPLQVALAELTTYLVTRSPLFCVHAGVVAGRDGCLAIPGDSGHGKTTLVAALTGAGFGYVSDEVLAMQRHSRELWRFARPLSVDARSWRVLGLAPDRAPEPGREQLIRLSELGVLGEPKPLRQIVLSSRTDGPTRLERSEPGAAVQALLRNSFNHFTAGASSFRVAVAAVRSAEVWRLSYRDAPEAAAELASRWL
jgi:hypothetical protein